MLSHLHHSPRALAPDRPRAAKTDSGISLVELMAILAGVGILAVLSVPLLGRSLGDVEVKAAARSIGDLLRLARSEAIRTSNPHVVFFGPPGTTDPAGAALQNTSGGGVPLLALNDGPQTTSNCRIDAGEAFETVPATQGISWGVSNANVRAPGDNGGTAFTPPQASGSTFADPAANAVNWVLFRPDGIPVVFTGSGGDCGTVGTTGTGGAGIYITNGRRDYGVVLAPLGGVRIHHWTTGATGWSG